MAPTSEEAAQLFRQDPEQLIDVGLGQVAYRRVGQGPDVVFSHGWPVSGATFRSLLPHLADHVTCHIIDYAGTGSSTFAGDTPLSIAGHIEALRHVIDELGLNDVAVVGHDSGGMIARHALAGDDRVRAFGMINTETAVGLGWRFKAFLANRHVPGFGSILGWVAGNRRQRRGPFAFGGCFVDKSLLDGEFDEFFLQPLNRDKKKLDAGITLLKSFDMAYVDQLAALHEKMTVPVKLVWGVEDPFFPIDSARREVATYPNATLAEIEGAALFSHEEKPAEVAAALLEVLV